MYDWDTGRTAFLPASTNTCKSTMPARSYLFLSPLPPRTTLHSSRDNRLLDKIHIQIEKFGERISNTTFAQDAYFGHLYDIYTKRYAQRGSLIALSDHSWRSSGTNTISTMSAAAFENFLAAYAVCASVPMRKDFAVGSTVTAMQPRWIFFELSGSDRPETRFVAWRVLRPWLLASLDRSEPRLKS